MKSKPGEVTQAVKDAIDAGYRHIDGALAYQNENEVGDAIQAKLSEGVVKREDLFVVSKVWNTYHRADLVPVGLKKTLGDLRLDYLDLYLIHWPMGYLEDRELFPKDDNGKFLYSDADFVDTWKAMEECVNQGLIKSIGLSNFNSQQIERVLSIAKIKPAVLQVESHPYLNQQKLLEFCKSKGIILTAYSPLGSPDRPWAKPDDPKLLDDPKLVELSKKLKKSPAQIILRWQVQRGVIVIPKTVTKSRLIENISIFDFELDQKAMDYITSMDCGGRACVLEWANDHKYYPFNIEF
ncbi:Aldo-keto reductase family 1 member B10 [Orchesella cincta]|uniref:Aldo-keto reductase family 1 member B10 n=1 Tax=Orchesella cincta TaxID=48709 RepID=A0A1D2NLR7_ORCCI|nr:Aldo-keto reductase family 1 member B10 [Orchesella cincta]